MKQNGLVDDVISEPSNGAHRDQEKMFDILRDKLQQYLKELDAQKPQERIDKRIEKFNQMGFWK
jgi:acetyl-CoA carboxylase carboxyl transferase subunit alpha